MKTSMLVSMTVAAASAAMADVVLPDTSTIAEIQTAVDDAQPGEVITLADGTYVLDQTLYVTNGVTLGANALAALSDTTTLGDVPLKKLRAGLGSSEGSVPAGMLLVSRTEVEAAGAEAIEVANGTALLGISVCTNSDLTASTATWAPVSFRKSDLEVSADGTKILAPIPANTEKGFMILRSGN